jgi:hypothetical protein
LARLTEGQSPEIRVLFGPENLAAG